MGWWDVATFITILSEVKGRWGGGEGVCSSGRGGGREHRVVYVSLYSTEIQTLMAAGGAQRQSLPVSGSDRESW